LIISRTPHRISFFGGGTDYPAYYLKYGGRTLGAAIDKYCYLNVRKLPPYFWHKHRIVYSRQENVLSVDEIEHPAVRETLKYLKTDYGVSIHHDGDIPARSGMGSSSAFTVGLLNSMNALNGKFTSKQELAEQAIRIEQSLIGENVGSQDQAFAAYGGFNIIDFHSSGDIAVQPVIIPSGRLRAFKSRLMLFFSGLSRISSDIAEEQVKNLPDNIGTLHEMKSLTDRALGVLASEKPLERFGALLHQNWELKKSLSGKITNPEIERMYVKAVGAGASGGKILGAGGGGFMLVFAEPEYHESIKGALSDYLYVPFEFDFEGSAVIVYKPES
jgi:D-glycero-alpha-D-manno-heptose-7-phosphate kinase